MRLFEFDTAVLPAADRLAMFQAGAVDYDVAAIGDPLAFTTNWGMLKLGDLNAVRARISPVHYCRDSARIAADGEDRIAVLHFEQGTVGGTIDGRDMVAGPGQALVWDLARPLDMRADGTLDLLIVTMPRYMLDEVLPATSLAGVIDSCPELALAAGQVRYLFDHADALPEESAAFYGRALRTLFAAAMLPARHRTVPLRSRAAPLLLRICTLLDRQPDRAIDGPAIARRLAVPAAQVAETVERFGGLEAMMERRRLLAAYRLLSDPAEIAPVTAIAERCGFTDMPRFSRRFRATFQVTATEMRRRRHGHLPRWAGAYHIEQHYEALRRS